MAKVLVVANWKMNPATFREAKKLLAVEKKTTERAKKRIAVVIAPPTLYLRELAVANRSLAFAVQDAEAEPTGSHTGSISFVQARDAKASYAIIGHAERRAAGESDEAIRRKVPAALDAGLIPILCIGESARSEDGAHFEAVRAQLSSAIRDIPDSKLSKVVIAYEPVWAIGASEAMRPRDMHEMSIFIRKVAVESRGDAGHTLTILYGGSIDSTNAAAMLEGGDVAGFLVGRASADANKFRMLLEELAERA